MGQVPNLFNSKKYPDIYAAILDELSQQNGMDEKTLPERWAIFEERGKKNLHVIFAMSPVGEEFRSRLRLFPALVNCTTIDWFLSWPEKALSTVATKFLKDNHDVEEEIKPALSKLFREVHVVVGKMADFYLLEQRKHVYVTPTNYLTVLK
jgi:dynein heavy chain